MARSSLAAVLVLALVPLLLVANVSLWVTRAIIDAPTFVETVERALEDPAVAGTIADRATATVVRTIDALDPLVRGVAFAALGLPPEPDPATVEALARSRVAAVLDTSLLEEARERAALDLHTLLITGRAARSELLVLDGDTVLLDVRSVVGRALDTIDPRLGGLGLAVLPLDATRTGLLEVAGLEDARSRLATVQESLPALLVVIGLVAALAIVVGRDRAGIVGWIGVATVTVGVLSVAIPWIAGEPLLRGIEDELIQAVARAGYGPLTEPLLQQSIVMAAIGAVLIVNGWVAAAVAWTRGRAHVG